MVDYNREDLVFLNDKRILNWEKPRSEGSVSMLSFLNGSTKIKEFLGHEILDLGLRLGPGPSYFSIPYRVTVSAAVYKAEIARLDKNNEFGDQGAAEPEEEILCHGGIQIYRRGIITGTEVNGEELLINGKLWCAKKLEDMLPDITFYLPTTRELIQTVFGNQYRTEEQATKRVEGIIEGYKHQYQEEEKEMKHKISHGRMFYR